MEEVLSSRHKVSFYGMGAIPEGAKRRTEAGFCVIGYKTAGVTPPTCDIT